MIPLRFLILTAVVALATAVAGCGSYDGASSTHDGVIKKALMDPITRPAAVTGSSVVAATMEFVGELYSEQRRQGRRAEGGRVIAVGRPDQVQAHARVTAAYLGTCAHA
jgi:hypothetical protein